MMQMIVLGTVAVGALAAGGAYLAATRSVEIPAYSVVRADGDFELRRYPEMALAQVTREGTRRSSVQSAFSPLARYIFAKDRVGEKIAMTSVSYSCEETSRPGEFPRKPPLPVFARLAIAAPATTVAPIKAPLMSAPRTILFARPIVFSFTIVDSTIPEPPRAKFLQ